MTLERHIKQTVAVIGLHYINGAEVIHQVVLQAEGQLYGGRADQQRHMLLFLHLHEFELFFSHEQNGPFQEPVFQRRIQVVIIGNILAQNAIVHGLPVFILLFHLPRPVPDAIVAQDRYTSHGHQQDTQDYIATISVHQGRKIIKNPEDGITFAPRPAGRL